jgi:hypothetical protein
MHQGWVNKRIVATVSHALSKVQQEEQSQAVVDAAEMEVSERERTNQVLREGMGERRRCVLSGERCVSACHSRRQRSSEFPNVRKLTEGTHSRTHSVLWLFLWCVRRIAPSSRVYHKALFGCGLICVCVCVCVCRSVFRSLCG